MSISREQVEHVAKLAALDLTEDEKELFGRQLSQVLEHAEVIKSVPTEGVPPTSHSFPLTNVLRQDAPRASLSQEEALANAPATEEGFFVVPKII
jgi:aspartyl-tRNA(Asn)/glutamyl-tRNA(Gln) amidotransferase subunit C